MYRNEPTMNSLQRLPLQQPKPDVHEFISAILGRATPTRTLLVEYLIDDVVRKPIITDLLGYEWVDEGQDRESQAAYFTNFIRFWQHMGYDFVRFERSLPFQLNKLSAADTAPGSAKQRQWVDQHHGVIASWEDFERYPWPSVAEMDFFPYEYLNSHLPDGMGLIVCHAGGLFEHLSMILSYEGLCLALYDQPGLVQAVVDKLGSLMTGFYRQLLDLDRVVAIFPGDDMGFRSGTLVSPDHLRRLVLPWHKRFAEMTHARGLPYFLHSCGNLLAIMDDLIDDVGIDAKHSYEDAILPVQEFQARFGGRDGRIGVLGGLDVHILASGTPDDVRRKTRFLVETCGSRGRYAVGSGNSIPSYIPVENYLAMIDEALAVGAG